MKFIFTAIAVLIASFLRSQAKPSTNKIDLTVGGKGSMNLPYDSAFTLSMHYKSVPTVFTTTLVRMRQRQGIVKALSSSKRVNTLEHEVVGDSLINVEFRYESRNKSGIIKPAQQYKLILLSGILSDIYKPESKTTVFEQFFDAININGTVDSNKLGKAISHYDQIYRDQVKNFKGLTTLGNALDAFKYYRDKIYYLDSLYHTQLASVKKNNDIAGLFAPKDLDDNKVHLRSIYQFAQCGTGPCKGVCWKKACSDSACSLLRTLKALWLFPDTLFNQINDGSIILTDILKAESQIKKASNVISEISYVDQTNQNLQEVLNWIAEIELENRGDSDNFCYRDINALKDIVVKYQRTLSVRKSSYNSLQSYQKKITTILINTSPMLFSGVDINDADSYVFDFQTRASLYITPIFGYAVFGFQKGFTDFSPYLGFQVNLAPMNRNIPFRLIPQKTILQRLCITTAWTLRSVSSPGKRTDFFGNSSSLITAFGFKLNHVFMLNYGALWFKEINPNPFITDKKLKATPSLSLSINLAIRDLLNGFTTLIPSL